MRFYFIHLINLTLNVPIAIEISTFKVDITISIFKLFGTQNCQRNIDDFEVISVSFSFKKFSICDTNLILYIVFRNLDLRLSIIVYNIKINFSYHNCLKLFFEHMIYV